ncbi:hypothetical protein OEZ86_005389 [Tetradesmus obliquus]|uniref:Uncharacterized protein n=1 Tax=Tetradesmus obliquus TaxID=3088 RepID=A0ABY8UBZ5_TETOB|nr:hypothetical protein OEZ85_003640 [Tetradesmus obliquus]WIA39268.1 hypothetical protein OEZ86_005389 [Tetradesmus obliquus]
MASLRGLISVFAAAGPASAHVSTGWAPIAVRAFSAIGGKPNPMDVLTRQTNPQMSQESTTESEAFEMKVPGVTAFMEPNVPKPGTVQPPNPSPELMEPVPIAKVTHDGDVIGNMDADAPASGQPRN